VLLKIDLESSSLSGSAGDGGSLITNKRSISTSVLIRDGGTLVLGGLIQNSTTNTSNSVPLLGKIPILGELFRTRDTEKSKTNLLVFLRPHILRNDEQAQIQTEERYKYIQNEQRLLNKDPATWAVQPLQRADPLVPIPAVPESGNVPSPPSGTTPPIPLPDAAPIPPPGPATSPAADPATAPVSR
jgi:general secretion pathway protein D